MKLHAMASTSAAIQQPTNSTIQPEKQRRAPKPLSWKDFSRRFLHREDLWKYELVEGQVEKTPRIMDTKQIFIKENLDSFLDSLRAANSSTGRFHAETDIFLSSDIHRRPDMAYFTNEQVRNGKDGRPILPEFVIEVISLNDNINQVYRKVRQYFEGGIRIVWLIFPELQEVHVLDDATRSAICRGEALCSAEAVVPGFVLPAEKIFS